MDYNTDTDNAKYLGKSKFEIDEKIINSLPVVLRKKYQCLVDIERILKDEKDSVIIPSLIQSGKEVAKDILQIIIRMPVLVFTAAIIKTVGDKRTFRFEATDNKTILFFNLFLNSVFSDGSWEEMVSFLGQGSARRGYVSATEIPGYAEFKNEYEYLRELCLNLKNKYYYFDIKEDDNDFELFSEWRNYCVGHSAFKCEDNNKESLYNLVERVKEIILTVDFPKYNQSISISFLKKINYGLFVNESKIYDSFILNKGRAFVLDYDTGKKIEDTNLSECMKELARCFNENKDCLNIKLLFSKRQAQLNQQQEERNVKYEDKVKPIILNSFEKLGNEQINEFPEILKVKYKYLVDLVDVAIKNPNNVVLASLIQSGKEVSKDILQIIVRIPTLTLVSSILTVVNNSYLNDNNRTNISADICNQENSDKKTVQLIDKLLKTVFSDGSWEELLRILGNGTPKSGYVSAVEIPGYVEFRNEYEYLRNLCATLKKEYFGFNVCGINQFSQWRNEYLGHSAYNSYETNVCLLIDLLKRINDIIKKYNFQEYNSIIKKEFLEKIGYSVFIKGSSMFDSYVVKKRTAYILDYAKGEKRADIELSAIFNKLNKRFYDEQVVLYENRVYDDEGVATDEISYQDLPVICEYLYGDIFRDIWDAEKDTRLVLLLGEAGIGKSKMSDFLDTSTKLLERYPSEEERIFSISKGSTKRDLPIYIWTFHINSYNTNSLTGQQGFLEFLCNHVINDDVDKAKNKLLETLFLHDGDESKAFVELVNAIMAALDLSEGKLVVILDGVDKIRNPNAKEGNLGILFSNADFSSNVSFVFTASDEKRINETLGNSISYRYEKTHERYIAFLYKYLNANMPWKELNKAVFLEMSDNKIGQLSAICNVSKYKPELFIKEFYDKREFSMRRYLRAIQEIEGKEYAQNLGRILFVLSVFEEPLSIMDLAILSLMINEDRIHSMLYKCINDLKFFLTVDTNSSRGDLYSLEDKKWIEELQMPAKGAIGEDKPSLYIQIENSYVETWRELLSIDENLLFNHNNSIIMLIIDKFFGQDVLERLDSKRLYANIVWFFDDYRCFELERCLKLVTKKITFFEHQNTEISDCYDYYLMLLTKYHLLIRLHSYEEAYNLSNKLWNKFQEAPTNKDIQDLYYLFHLGNAELFDTLGLKFNSSELKEKYEESYYKLVNLNKLTGNDIVKQEVRLKLDLDMIRFLFSERRVNEAEILLQTVERSNTDNNLPVFEIAEIKLSQFYIKGKYKANRINAIVAETEKKHIKNDIQSSFNMMHIYISAIHVCFTNLDFAAAENYVKKAKSLCEFLVGKGYDGEIIFTNDDEIIINGYFQLICAFKNNSYEQYKQGIADLKSFLSATPIEFLKLHENLLKFITSMDLNEADFHNIVVKSSLFTENKLSLLTIYLQQEKNEAEHRNNDLYWTNMYNEAFQKIVYTLNVDFLDKDSCKKFIDTKFEIDFANLISDDDFWSDVEFCAIDDIVQFLGDYGRYKTYNEEIIDEKTKNVLLFCYLWRSTCREKFSDSSYDYDGINYKFAGYCLSLSKQCAEKDIKEALMYCDEAIQILGRINTRIPQASLDATGDKLKYYDECNIEGELSIEYDATTQYMMGRAYLAKSELFLFLNHHERDAIAMAECAIAKFTEDLSHIYSVFNIHRASSDDKVRLETLHETQIVTAYLYRIYALFRLEDYSNCIATVNSCLSYKIKEKNRRFLAKKYLLLSYVKVGEFTKADILLDELNKECREGETENVKSDFYEVLNYIIADINNKLFSIEKDTQRIKKKYCKDLIKQNANLEKEIKKKNAAIVKTGKALSSVENAKWYDIVKIVKRILLINQKKGLYSEIADLKTKRDLTQNTISVITNSDSYKNELNELHEKNAIHLNSFTELKSKVEILIKEYRSCNPKQTFVLNIPNKRDKNSRFTIFNRSKD